MQTNHPYHPQSIVPTYAMTLDYNYIYRPLYQPLKNNYEITTPHTEPDQMGLEALMEQRHDVLRYRINMVGADIVGRYQLKQKNIDAIDQDQCTCRSLIFQIGEEYMDIRRINLEREIIALEQEKRREHAGYFRDVMFLRKELRETLIEKLEEEQKGVFFTNNKEAIK